MEVITGYSMPHHKMHRKSQHCSFPFRLEKQHITWTWGPAPEALGTGPKCPTRAAEAGVKHLLRMCTGTRKAWDNALTVVGLRWDKSGDFNQWVQEDRYCRPLLNF